jgi:hypothetical protein
MPDASVLSLTTARPVSLDAVREDLGIESLAGPQSDVAEVSWWLEPGPDGVLELIRLERTPPDPETDVTQDPSASRTVLARGVREMSLRFFDGVEWWEEWDTSAQGNTEEEAITSANLPALVEITLTFDLTAANTAAGALPGRETGLDSAVAAAPPWTLVVALPQPVEVTE